MTTLDREVIAGIDTHADTHHVAVIDTTGRKLGDAQFPATLVGYSAIVAYLTGYGIVRKTGVEGTHSYGAGLTRHLQDAGIEVAEVLRPNRQTRRMNGKSDPIDAYAAAAAVLASDDHPTPKALEGPVEQIRFLHVARRSAVKARTAARVQIKSLLVTAPDRIRERYRHLSDTVLLRTLAKVRPTTEPGPISAAALTALRSIARRYQNLTVEITDLEHQLDTLVGQAAPALHATKGVGTITAAQLLVTAGQNSDRLTSEASFAALCGTNPIPASSGKTTRHRLNRGGDRQANAALHHIALTRMTYDTRTCDYVSRKRTEGKGTMEILRCLKRSIAREMFHLITNPTPVTDWRELRPARQAQGLTQHDIGHALRVSTAKISLIERGLTHDEPFTHTYQQWLQTHALHS
jgi:transposase